eukprot:UN20566
MKKDDDTSMSFNHASCQCCFPPIDVDAFLLLAYEHLEYMHLTEILKRDKDGKEFVDVGVEYGGIVAL